VKKIIIWISAILLLLDIFLPIFKENIDTRSFFGFNIFPWLWLGTLLIFEYKRFISKTYILLYLFIFIAFIMNAIYWYKFNSIPWMIYDIRNLFIATTLIDYFISSKDYKGLNICLYVILASIVITCLIDIFIFYRYGYTSRSMEQRQIRLKNFGYAGIGYYYGICLTLPVIMACFKSSTIRSLKKWFLLFYIIIVIYALFLAEFATPFLIGTLGLIFGYLGRKRVKYSLFLAFIIICVGLLLPRNIVSEPIYYLAEQSEGETMSARLSDVGLFISGEPTGSPTVVESRGARIPIQLKNIAQSPIIGGGPTTEHCFWLDRFSMFGIIGMLPWILILIYQFRLTNFFIDNQYRYYYYVCFSLFIIMGSIKIFFDATTYVAIFMIAPGLYLSDLYEKHIIR
jgi:hypothetical protein